MADVVLDANVLVGYLDANDVQHVRACKLIESLESDGHAIVLADLLISEAISVLCRRARERKANPPDLATVLEQVRSWNDAGEIESMISEIPRIFIDVLDVIRATSGALNFNDAVLVVLQQQSVIGDVASFDEAFGHVGGFRRLT